MNWRRLRLGLATLLGPRARGFFIPYRYADTLPPAGFRGRFPAVEARFAAAEAAFATALDAMDGLGAALAALGREAPPAPRWTQMWFPRLDAAMAYTLVRTRRPARFVEIGSGHSTRFIARAIRDGGFACSHHAIDPAPRADLLHLPVKLQRKTLADANLTPIADLEAGDMLFVDSSHILMPGSDVDLLLNQILPGLPAGVLVHFHDIFLPDDYPVAWAWRGYNEQQGLGALLSGGGWDIVFSSRYALTRMPKRFAASVAAKLPFTPGSFEASLWLVKR
jgi:hypothetical protein